jgi:hypothetical protein
MSGHGVLTRPSGNEGGRRVSPKIPLRSNLASGGARTSVVVEPVAVRALLPTPAAGELPTIRDLLLQSLLHLPRLADADGTIDVSSALAEIERLRLRRAVELAPLRWMAAPPTPALLLDQLEVTVVPAEEAEPILAHFHYLRSFRPDAINFGAVYRQQIVALCSVSPLDLAAILGRLPIGSLQEAAVVSRVFAFDWAPRNVISFLLARTEESLALNRNVRVLLTYLNPNMGFDGASYKAANWMPLGLETGTRYAYLHGEYVTDRRLSNLPQSERRLVEYSQMHLLPLQVLGRFLDKDLARAAAHMPKFVVQRGPASER